MKKDESFAGVSNRGDISILRVSIVVILMWVTGRGQVSGASSYIRTDRAIFPFGILGVARPQSEYS